MSATYYTDCQCIFHPSRQLEADNDSLFSTYSDDGANCYYSLEWTLTGPDQYFNTCSSGTCGNGEQEVLENVEYGRYYYNDRVPY